ncbi:MAG: hypothetical protein ACJAXS_003445 [Colwellia sp.]|jgi:hypothetical protein
MKNLFKVFKHKKSPPITNKKVIKAGAKALIIKAVRTIISLFNSEPLATANTTGNSPSAFTPETCSALSAKSTPSTPATFFAATFDRIAASSSAVVVSSSRLINLMLPKVSH